MPVFKDNAWTICSRTSSVNLIFTPGEGICTNEAGLLEVPAGDCRMVEFGVSSEKEH